MRLTSRGRYAVMAMADLAARDGDKPICLAEIALRQNISLSYLEQLFCKLRKAELVRSVRGPGGGYMLGKPAAQLAIADIVAAVNEPFEAEPLADGAEGQCCLQDLLGALGSHIQLFLCSVSLADLIEGRLKGGVTTRGSRVA